MTDVVLRIQTALGGAVADVSKFRESIASTTTATGDLRETWKATTAEIVASTQKQIAAEKEKIDQYRAEIKAIQEVTSSYQRGSDERQVATKMEIDLQRKLQVALGETASVATKTAAKSAEARDASGFSRGAASRSGVVGSGMSALAGPGFLAGAIIGGTVDAGVKAAEQEQVALKNLQNALRDTGQARNVSRKQLDDYIIAEEHATGFQRDEVAQTLSQLIRSTGDLGKARREEAVMADVARARNTDLSGAMMLVMRAAEGNVGSLKRLGIEIPKVTTYEDQLKAAHLTGNLALEKRAKALDLAATKSEVMRAVTQKFAGDSKAYMSTFGGETAKLSNTWRDLEVEIGQKAIPLLTQLFGWIEKEVTALEHNQGALQDIKTGFHVVEGGIQAVDKVTGGFLHTLELLAAWYAAGKVVDYATKMQKSLVGAYDGAAKAVNAFRRTNAEADAAVAADSEAAGAAVDAAFPWAIIIQAAALAAVEIVQHWGTVKKWFLDFWGWLKTGWKDAVDFIKGVFYAWVASEILILKALADAAASALGWVPGIGGKLKAAASQIDQWYTEFKGKSEAAFADIGKASAQSFVATYYATASKSMSKAGAYVPPRAAGPRGQRVGGYITTTGDSAVQKGLVQTAQTTIGNPYQYGGTPSLSSPTDCSGLMVAIFAKQGISLPRTSEEQYAQAPIKNARPLAPGDLVFSEGIHPGHVGLYIGSGNVLQDPHTGASVDVMPLKDWGWNGESARWWGAKAKKTPHGGSSNPTTTTPAGWDTAVKQAQSAAAGAKAASSGAKAPTLIGLRAQIEAELKALPKDLDPVEKEAVRHIKAIRDSLHVGMSQTELAKDRADLKKWGTTLKDEIKKNADEAKKAAAQHAKEVKAAAQAAAKAFADGWAADTNIINRAIQEQWANVQKVFDRETQGHLTQMQRQFQAQMNAFDADTQKGLDSFVVAQTPQEKALADFQAQIAAQQHAQTVAQQQSDLAAAIASGDPAQIKQAQDAINQQMQQDQLDALQTAADASRKAADAQTAQQQAAYQAQRDAQKQALQDQEALTEQAYQDQRDAQWQALNDQHDDQVAMFDADLKLWQTALQNKSKTWVQFLKWLKENPISSAVDGGTISDPLTYTEPTLPDGTPTQSGGGKGGGGGSSDPSGGHHPGKTYAGGIHLRPTVRMLGDQGPEATVPLAGQQGQRAIDQLAHAIVRASAGNTTSAGTTIYGTFLGATPKQVGRALEGLVTPAQARVVRYKAPL